MKNNLRSFIAVSLSLPILQSIEKLLKTLRVQLDDVHWVETKNMHVTLKFLGDIPLNDLPQLIRAVTQSVEQIDSFDLAFQGIGVFPHPDTPKTVWVGCQEGSDELIQLAETISTGLVSIGFPQESRRFSPHLTLGRVKKSVQADSFKPILQEHQGRQFGSCSVSEVQIFSSERTRRGPIYEELASIPLR